MTKEDLIRFEEEIAEIFSQGKIKAPVHLRKGREEYLIDIFKKYNINQHDWVFGYWDSHELALLKGVPREQVRKEILKGNSIALCFPEYNVLCSGIVASLVGVATGAAWSLKNLKQKRIIGNKEFMMKTNAQVYHFCGDMSAETGAFHEAVKYAYNWDLPIKFVVCDNSLSVMTDTRATWNDPLPWFVGTKYEKKIEYFRYINGYPHSGLGKLIKF